MKKLLLALALTAGFTAPSYAIDQPTKDLVLAQVKSCHLKSSIAQITASTLQSPIIDRPALLAEAQAQGGIVLDIVLDAITDPVLEGDARDEYILEFANKHFMNCFKAI